MKTFRALCVRLAGLFRRKQHEAEMNEELRAHLDGLTERNIAAGMSPDEAKFAALREFGGVEQIKERARDERRSAWGEQVCQDCRYAVRQVRKAPGFTAIIVLTLALGIGANTAVFTVIHALVLRALPVHDPDRLVFIERLRADGTRAPWFNYEHYTRMSEGARLLAGLAAASSANSHSFAATDSDGGETEPVRIAEVSGNYFSVLGAAAGLGRTLSPLDDSPTNPRAAVVLSHAFWQRRFGGDPAVIGKSVRLDEYPFTIVGVAAAGFAGLDPLNWTDMWLPLQMVPHMGTDSRIDGSGLRLVGRLRREVSAETARGELDLIFQQERFAGQPAATKAAPSAREVPPERIGLQPARAGESGLAVTRTPRHPLFILMTIAALVLLIACANVAGLLLARGAVRQREFAVRSALGAGRGRLFRQLLIESAVVALAGGLFGLLFAQWGTSWIAVYLPEGGGAVDLRPDGRILVFTFLIATLVGVLCGLAPALCFSRLDLLTALKNQTTNLAGRSRRGLNSALVVTQIALSVGLLAGAGLFIRSLQNLKNVDAGFNRENVLLFSIRYSKDYNAIRRANLFKDVLAGVESLPGVRSATMSIAGLLSGGGTAGGFGVEGYTPLPGERMNAKMMMIGPKFFETLGIPLLRGRGPTAEEIQYPSAPGSAFDRPNVIVIGESLARRYFGESDPIGRHILLKEPAEIIGVAKDTKYFGLRNKTVVDLYLPEFAFLGEKRASQGQFEIRTSVPPTTVAADVRAAIRQIDPAVWVGDVRTMEEVVADNLKPERQLAQVAGFFSVLALALAGLGLYGMLAYHVTQRTREIGVRMALGADMHVVLLLVLKQGLGLALLGCVVGIGVAVVSLRVVASRFFDVTPTDPATYLVAACVLVGVAAFACWFPARRAARVDPMVALRAE